MPSGRLGDERGVALIMALVVIVILTGIILALASMTTSDVETNRLTQTDTFLQYLAQAAAEHQIYVLKGDINGAAVACTNYPVLPGETEGSGRYWYRTELTCTGNCSSSTSRTWTIDAFGELRSSSCSGSPLQQRTVRVKVQITYSGGAPTAVTLTEWAEVYP